MTFEGGTNGYGVLFEWDPDMDIYSKKLDFNKIDNGSYPIGKLVQTENGMFYGVTSRGGENDHGVIFEWDPINNNCNVKISFEKAENGFLPISLMQADNGKMYGITQEGGLHGYGVLFEWDPSKNVYIKKLDFNWLDNGSYPNGQLLQTKDGKLYGMTQQGGVYGYGVLFEWNPETNIFIKKLDFNDTISGKYPQGSLLQLSNGKLYGMTSTGGVNGHIGNADTWYGDGVLFEWNPTTDIFIKKLDFDRCVKGSRPRGSLIQANNGKLYGLTSEGGASDQGVLFEWDSEYNNFTKKIDFEYAEIGSNPIGPMIKAGNLKLYGTTQNGGLYNSGVLYEWDPLTNICSKKVDLFKGNYRSFDGNSLMLADDGKFYGVIRGGGENSYGIIFKWDPVTNIFSEEYNFKNIINERWPLGILIQAINGKIYGVTDGDGGIEYSDIWNLFEWDPLKKVFTKLDMETANRTGRHAGYIMQAQNGKLYGTTCQGDTKVYGVIFEYDPLTNIYIETHNFINLQDGSCPLGPMIQLNNGKLYGMTSGGGAYNGGVLFEWDPDTDIYTKKLDFNQFDNGRNPNGSLMKANNGKIYGMTTSGGAYNSGVLFEWDPINNNCTIKNNFNTREGMNPRGGLIEIKYQTMFSLSVETCETYTSPSGKYVWTSTGDYNDTLTSVAGCDSIISVNLTMNNRSTSMISSTACDAYVSPSGKIWTESGEYMDTIPNVRGCDSIITVNLAIIRVDTSVTQSMGLLTANADEANYQWIDCNNNNTAVEGEIIRNYRPSKSGHYAVIVFQNGCTDTSACRFINVTGLVSNTFKQNIILHPNPNEGLINIDLGRIYPNIEIIITELDGRVKQKEKRYNTRTINLPLNTSSGIYMVIISSGNERAVFKIAKK